MTHADFRTYLTLETTLSHRLLKAWRAQSSVTLRNIKTECDARHWDAARLLANNLSMKEVGSSNREWIKYLLRSCAVHGASMAAAGPSFIATGTFDKMLDRVTSTFLKYLEHGASTQVRDQALQLIAKDQASHTAFKFNENTFKADDSVDFSDLGDDQILLGATLNACRLDAWGFLAEAQANNIQTYKINAILDGRCCDFCHGMNGKTFSVDDGIDSLNTLFQCEDPNDLKTLAPWPKQDKESLQQYSEMDSDELAARGYSVPPFHAYCRCVLSRVEEDEGVSTEKPDVAPDDLSIPEQICTVDTFKELGIDVDEDEVEHWNTYVRLSPVEFLAQIGDADPKDVLEGIFGSNAIQFEDNGDITTKLSGLAEDAKFNVQTQYDPYSGILAIVAASVVAGSLSDEQEYVRNFLDGSIDVGVSSGARSLTVQVSEGAAMGYLKLGFLPTATAWSALRMEALDTDFSSLPQEDATLVQHLLQSDDPASAGVLADLAIDCNGQQIGDMLLASLSGVFALDLNDDKAVEQAREYLDAS